MNPPRGRTLCEGGIDHELNVRFLLAGALASAAALTPVTETAAATECQDHDPLRAFGNDAAMKKDWGFSALVEVEAAFDAVNHG
jgi:hypothetical protein